MKMLPIAAIAALIAWPAQASLTLSGSPTANVDCSGGVCTANAAAANLNVNDLKALLASSDVRVLSETAALQNIEVQSPLSWSSSHSLSLESNDAIHLQSPITVKGTARFALNHNGGIDFQKKGAVHFWDVASQFSINGASYTLVNSITGLAAAVASSPNGLIAFANDYDARQDGQLTKSPVSTTFNGVFEGLGNKISNFSIWDTADTNVALFSATKHKAELSDFGIVNANVLSENTFNNVVGTLVAYNAGEIYNCYATGQIRSDFLMTGGGLVGQNYGTVYRSWANVFVSGAESAEVGGLIGNAHGQVQDVYATGRVIAGDQSDVGGLIGYNFAHVRDGYATGQVSAGQSARVGGVMGTTQLPVHNTYWDTETSGTQFGVGGTNIRGITGLTTAELQAKLPKGFAEGTWAQSTDVNGGLPYLLTNPPRN